MKRGDILLIDDSKVELRLLDEAFRKTHFPRNLITFTEAETAYQYITKHIKDIFVIICDIKMPGMSGPDLLEKINQDRELRMQAIPFIFLTNSSQDNDIEHCYLLSANGYFQKPFKIEDMTELFNSIINYWTSAYTPYHKNRHSIH